MLFKKDGPAMMRRQITDDSMIKATWGGFFMDKRMQGQAQRFLNDDHLVQGYNLICRGFILCEPHDSKIVWSFKLVQRFSKSQPPKLMDKHFFYEKMHVCNHRKRTGLTAGDPFEKFLEQVGQEIQSQVEKLAEHSGRLLLPPAPYRSVLMNDCRSVASTCLTALNTITPAFMARVTSANWMKNFRIKLSIGTFTENKL